MLYTAQIQDLNPNEYDEIWLCVRSLRSAPKPSATPTYHKPVLSPSTNLLSKALQMQKSNNWTKESFDEIFKPTFFKEMLQEKPLKELHKLADLSKTKNICIACYCDTDYLCHRYLIEQIINTILS